VCDLERAKKAAKKVSQCLMYGEDIARGPRFFVCRLVKFPPFFTPIRLHTEERKAWRELRKFSDTWVEGSVVALDPRASALILVGCIRIQEGKNDPHIMF
jgi:hypothetical protein